MGPGTGSRLIVCALVALGACAVAAASAAAQPASTPKHVVLTFYPAVYQPGNDAEKLLSAPLAEKVRKEGGLMKYVGDRTGGVQVRGVQVLKEQVTGQTAIVSYILHLVDGTTKKCEDNLVVEGGEWKITVPPPAKRK